MQVPGDGVTICSGPPRASPARTRRPQDHLAAHTATERASGHWKCRPFTPAPGYSTWSIQTLTEEPIWSALWNHMTLNFGGGGCPGTVTVCF